MMKESKSDAKSKVADEEDEEDGEAAEMSEARSPESTPYLFEFMQREQRNLLKNNMFLEAMENEKENELAERKLTDEEDNASNRMVNEDDLERRAIASFLKSSFSPRESANSSMSVSSASRLEELSLSSSTSSLSSAFALLSASASKSKQNAMVNSSTSVGKVEFLRTNNASQVKSLGSGVRFLKSKRRKTLEPDSGHEKTTSTSNNDEKNEEDNSAIINSDLEMEVASTLVGMKWLSTLKK